MYFDDEMYFEELDQRSEVEKKKSIADDNIPSLSPEERQQKRMRELRERVEEFKERSAQATEEAQREKEKSRAYEEILKCVVCEDIIRNPYSLECGHSACYSCLRIYWTKASDEESFAPIISTDEEEYGNDDDDKPHIIRRRRRFPSVVSRNKTCPRCQRLIKYRPSPDYRLRSAIDIIHTHDHPNSSHIQHKLSIHRKNPWHGIFPTQRDPEMMEHQFMNMNFVEMDPSMSFTSREVVRLKRLAHSMLAHIRSELTDAREHERQLTVVLEDLERRSRHIGMSV